MKKLLALVLSLALCLVGVAALAQDIDLSAMSFDELVTLRDQITTEITSRTEWKEVTVPPGMYEIGVDIPEGYWMITIEDGVATIQYGSTPNESKTEIEYSGRTFNEVIGKNDPGYSIDMKDGNFVYIGREPVIFTPYIRPSLGF